MIDSLRGRWQGGILHTGGVGWAMRHTLTPEEGQESEVKVLMQWSDSGPSLYGFKDESERAMFRALIKVQGIGPAVAMNIMSEMGTAGAAAAVRSKDSARLQKVRGVGKAGSARIVGFCEVPADIGGEEGPAEDSMLQALLSMGFSEQEARAALLAASSEDEGQARLRAALRTLRGS